MLTYVIRFAENISQSYAKHAFLLIKKLEVFFGNLAPRVLVLACALG
jgi:hypothetical protein